MALEILFIQGAFNLDCLLNFNGDPHTQIVPDNWEDMFPNVVESINGTEISALLI